MRERAPCGTWESPLSAEIAGGGQVGLLFPRLHRGDVYWLEARPLEGRTALVRLSSDGIPGDVLPRWCNVRSRVHEDYGGCPYTLEDGFVYFVNDSDQRIYQASCTTGEDPQPLTPEIELRYADPVHDAPRRRLLCVAEDHSSDSLVVNSIVAVSLTEHGTALTLVSGGDFYASVRLDVDGQRLCWVTWSHPNMPWNGAELWIADLAEDGSVTGGKQIAGGDGESVVQPEWAQDGALWFLSDRSGWWNLYRYTRAGDVEPVYSIEADCCRPPWQLGTQSYGLVDVGAALCVVRRQGIVELALIGPARYEKLSAPYVDYGDVDTAGGKAIVVAAEATRPPSIVEVDASSLRHMPRFRDQSADLDQRYMSSAEMTAFPTTGDATAYAYLYRPRNPMFTSLEGEKPPLLVRVHGGPTSAASPAYSLAVQFWTSRGFALLDVNYRGSTGHGRPYWEALYGCWGIVDVEDCASGARYLADSGQVDRDRLVIMGASAGGFTTLASLAFGDLFHAGISRCGVADLELMELRTHKFESRYTSRLTCGTDGTADLLRSRSPLHAADQIRAPVLLVQGGMDLVVPPEQTELIHAELVRRHVPTALLMFPTEGHAFLQAQSLTRILEAELSFVCQVFGIPHSPLAVDITDSEQLPLAGRARAT
jgi:dipeptidyl aminopeptidase/acylaminoacyl peptidase